MTLFFKNHQIQVYRRKRKGTSDRYTLSATFTAYPADLQPMAAERVQFVNGRIGATYDAYVDTSADIKESDQVHIIGGTYDGKVFSVKGVEHWEGAGLLDHTHIIMVAQDG